MLPTRAPHLPLVYPPVPHCQRWHHGRDRYRPAGELINMDRHRIEVIDEATAKAFVTLHHLQLFQLRSLTWVPPRPGHPRLEASEEG